MAKASDSLKLSAETGPLLEQTLAAAVKDRPNGYVPALKRRLRQQLLALSVSSIIAEA